MKVRTITEEDRPRLVEWLSRDEAHKGCDPNIYFEKNAKTLVFSDEVGPVLFVRCTSVLRLDIQFDCSQTIRNATMLSEGVTFMEDETKRQGFRQIIFDSTVKKLIRFCHKRLGFTASPNEFVKTI